MRVAIGSEGAVTVAAISGEVDLANRVRFADEILSRMPDDSRALIIDLAQLSYIDSAGVRSLFEIANVLVGRDQTLAIVIPEDSAIRTILTLTQIEDVTKICPTQSEAVRAVS